MTQEAVGLRFANPTEMTHTLFPLCPKLQLGAVHDEISSDKNGWAARDQARLAVRVITQSAH